MEASDWSAECAPVAALLYKPEALPGLADLAAASRNGGGFSVSHAPDSGEGWAEVLRDGLTFDIRGLKGGPALPGQALTTAIGLSLADVQDSAWLELAPGPHLAGAARLLPVIRVVSILLVELARIAATSAIAWIPARLVLKAELFEKAVKPWLDGGPFPAPAFVAMHRGPDGDLRTEGLNFLIGQEFSLRSRGLANSSQLPRVAVRLVDWLVAHGPVTAPTEAVLAGTGAVFLEADGGDRIVAMCD